MSLRAAPHIKMKLSWEKLLSEYNKRKVEIKNRLREFAPLHKGDEKRLFSELCFCLLTANANALHCDKAIRELKATGLLYEGPSSKLRPKLKGRVRFHNKKADFIVLARKIFKKGPCFTVKSRIDTKDVLKTREWLVENIKGLGYKEASHFLRNVGLGDNIAILDRHILKNLKRYGVIKYIPPSVGSRKTYLAIEEKMRRFSKQIGIPLPDLDLLFWSMQTGFIFK